MDQYFLGQYLSNRTSTGPRDSTNDKIWLALRYLILVGFFIALITLVDRDPAGAFLAALGGALLASALVNVAWVPKAERRDELNAIWAVAGIAGLVAGLMLLG